jgi:peptidyl-prolyl cis-trans isomerase D
MLKLMRDNLKNLKWILWFVVVVFVGLIFFDWGTGRAGRGGSGGDMEGIAARIGNVTITEMQFLKEMRSAEERYRQMYGEQFEALKAQLDLGSMTMQNLVDRQLLVAKANDMGIEISDEEVLEKIKSFPAFKRDDGAFVGEELYARILRSNQITPEEFESGLRLELKLQRLQDSLAAGVLVTDSDLEKEYRRRNESASFEVLFASADRQLGSVVVSDAETKAFYDANTSRFEHPEQRQLRYLLVDDGLLRRTLTVPDSQVVEYYNSHLQEFQAAEEVSARHILVRPKSQDDAGWKEAETRARDARARAATAGADFAAVAKQLSDDAGSKEGGGELGWFSRGRMVKEFEDAVFALQVGQVSEPVKSQFGYHIIKLEGRRPPRQRPLEEAGGEIRGKLVESLAEGEGSRRAAALREKIDAAKLATEEQWRGLADDVVSSNMTPFFGKDDVIPGIGRDQEILAEVNGAKEGFVGGPRRISRGWIVYRLAAIRPAGVTPFDEAKEQALDAVKRGKAAVVAAQKLSAERATLAGTPSWGEKATALTAVTQTVTDHRRGASIPNVGVASALEDAVFGTPVGGVTQVVTIGERGAALARVTAVKIADMQAFRKDKPSLRDSVVQEQLQRLLSSMLVEARRDQKVEINSALVERFKPKRG